MSSLLRATLITLALLTTAGLGASLSGCYSSTPASGFVMLRSSDLPFLRAVIPVLLEGVASAEAVASGVEDTLKKLDFSLQRLSPEMFKLTQQLFDVLGMGITRGPLTGIWGSWENASSEQIRNFLHRWENSYLNLLRMGQGSLLKLVIMAWYFQPASWAHCGYPGPPKI